MSEQTKIPDDLAADIERVFHALQQSKVLIAVGRAYGIGIGLSPALAAEMHRRFGNESLPVIGNTWRRSKEANINGLICILSRRVV